MYKFTRFRSQQTLILYQENHIEWLFMNRESLAELLSERACLWSWWILSLLQLALDRQDVKIRWSRSRMNTLVYFDQICPENGQICSHYGFHGLLGNANRWKMAVALALILQKIIWEIKNKYFEDLIWTFLKVFKQWSGGRQDKYSKYSKYSK